MAAGGGISRSINQSVNRETSPSIHPSIDRAAAANSSHLLSSPLLSSPLLTAQPVSFSHKVDKDHQTDSQPTQNVEAVQSSGRAATIARVAMATPLHGRRRYRLLWLLLLVRPPLLHQRRRWRRCCRAHGQSRAIDRRCECRLRPSSSSSSSSSSSRRGKPRKPACNAIDGNE